MAHFSPLASMPLSSRYSSKIRNSRRRVLYSPNWDNPSLNRNIDPCVTALVEKLVLTEWYYYKALIH